ncbi:MAG: molecular chaperone TorD family protein, partial [Motiliproteus sp.]|nr:molecular chaperone TorD family protein [Motiliproteus sp.]
TAEKIAVKTIDPQAVTPNPADSADYGYNLFRSDAYALLARLLAAPADEQLLNWLQQIELDENQDSLMNEAWTVLQLAASRAHPDQIAEEYQQLFIGIGRGELVPFGSWYLTGFLMEKPLVQLRHDLKQLGFERDEEVCEPEDHMAALSEVMAVLVNPEEGFTKDQQQTFYNLHVGCWSQRFFIDLQNAKNAHFYSAVGRFGEIFTGMESLLLEPENTL